MSAGVGYKGEEAPEGADVYTVTNNGTPGNQHVQAAIQGLHSRTCFVKLRNSHVCQSS